MSASIAIITALQREVYPLVKDWSEKSGGVPDGCACFVNAGTAVLCGGIGYRSARIAAEVMVEKFHPEMLVSAGLAGALVPGMRVGQVIEPAQILDLSTGSRYSTESGRGVLVTAVSILGAEAKKSAAREFGAELVDMEAAAVAEVAKRHGIEFRALKAISDEFDVDLPDFGPFIDAQGGFRMGKFVMHLAVHPVMWHSVIKLGYNSKKAAKRLCWSLRVFIEEHQQRAHEAPPLQGKESLSK